MSDTNTDTATGAIAEAYFAAWKANDWERLRGLLADEVSFRGPLASIDGRVDTRLDTLGTLPLSSRLRSLRRSDQIRVVGRHKKQVLAALREVAQAPYRLADALAVVARHAPEERFGVLMAALSRRCCATAPRVTCAAYLRRSAGDPR